MYYLGNFLLKILSYKTDDAADLNLELSVQSCHWLNPGPYKLMVCLMFFQSAKSLSAVLKSRSVDCLSTLQLLVTLYNIELRLTV